MKKVFSFRAVSILIITLTLISCEELPFGMDKRDQGRRKGPFHFGHSTLINNIIDSVEGGVDAIQYFKKSETPSVGPPGMIEVESSQAKAIYFIADTAGPVSSVECNGNSLDYSSWPIHYNYSWEADEGPTCNSDIYWETVFYGGETVCDTIPVPNGFSGLAFTSDSLDIETGGTLTWNTTTDGDVGIYIAWSERYPDGETGWVHTHYYGKTPDDGSFEVTPQVLSDAGVPETPAEVAGVGIGLYKWNLKTKYYDSGNKQLLNIAIVGNAAQFWVIQEE